MRTGKTALVEGRREGGTKRGRRERGIRLAQRGLDPTSGSAASDTEWRASLHPAVNIASDVNAALAATRPPSAGLQIRCAWVGTPSGRTRDRKTARLLPSVAKRVRQNHTDCHRTTIQGLLDCALVHSTKKTTLVTTEAS